MLQGYLDVRNKLLPSYGTSSISNRHKKYIDLRFKLLPVDHLTKRFLSFQTPNGLPQEAENNKVERLSVSEENIACEIFQLIDIGESGFIDINSLSRTLSTLKADFTENRL